MRKQTLYSGILTSLALWGAPSAALAMEETPMITFHTTVYENTAEENAFHIIMGAKEDTWIDIDYGFGPEEVKVGPAVFNPDTRQIDGTWINGSVSKEGVVKIYGDASLIDYLDMQGCYIDRLSMETLTELTVLDLSYNEIESLDLTPMTKLEALYLKSNPFNASPLVVGSDKPNLTILDLSLVGNLTPDFDITTYGQLASFEGWSTPTLTHLDPTHCPDLLRLSIDDSGVESLDISRNPNLLILNIGKTGINSIDLSTAPYLTEFYCTNSYGDTGLTTLDISHNRNLVRLGLGYNSLTSIDVSTAPKLQFLHLRNNLLTDIEISNCPDINILDIKNNFIPMDRLPEPRMTFTEYYYQQRPILLESSYQEGAEIDLASKVMRKDSETIATLFAYDRANPSDAKELGEDFFSFDKGVVTLLKQCPDSLYLSFTNTALPDYPMTTSRFKVKDPAAFGNDNPMIMVNFSSLEKNLAMSVGIAGASPENPKNFSIDFGNGNPIGFTATSAEFPAEPNATGTRAGQTAIIYLPEGESLTAFGISSGRVQGIDLQEAVDLTDLRINNANLADIDLQWNGKLRNLDLNHNNLTKLNLSGANGSFEKIQLQRIAAADNKLTSLTLPLTTVKEMNLSHNQFEEFNWTKSNTVESLDLSYNLLSSANLQDMESLRILNLRGNQLNELEIPDYVELSELDITLNNIPLSQLPAVGTAAFYQYAPQNTLLLPEKAPTANLSKEYYVDPEGRTTSYEWRFTETGEKVGEGEIAGSEGKFKFTNPDLGNIYCEITHPAFPDFTGENAIKTTGVTTAPMPTHVFASFKTLEAKKGEIVLTGKSNGATVYIDWTGKGDVEQYILATRYTRFPIETLEGADVKCYSYEEDDQLSVFSLSNIALGYMDASPMKGLTTFRCEGGLKAEDLRLPSSAGLQELCIPFNRLTELPDLTPYPGIVMLDVKSNPMTKLDVRGMKNLTFLYASDCQLTEAIIEGDKLDDVNLMNNELETIDLSHVPAIYQLFLSNNRLTEVNVDAIKQLRVLTLDRNRLSIATLPLPKPEYYIYYYSNQAPLAPEVVNGKVDLSELAERAGEASVYRWFVDSPYLDEENELAGDELAEGTDFTLDKGVTTFLKPGRNLVGVVTNGLLPDLYMLTGFLDVNLSAVEALDAEAENVEYYDLQGIRTEHPSKGLYIRVADGKSSRILIK